MIALVVMTDGRRDCLDRTMRTIGRFMGPITSCFVNDDSGDGAYTHWIRDRWPWVTVIGGPDRLGFAGAYHHTRRWLRDHTTEPFILSTEDDFLVTEFIDLCAWLSILDANRHVAQIVAKRQPWNPAERAAGGIIEQHPDDYTDATDGDNHWVEHRRFWSTNPHLTRRATLDVDWPDGPESEGRFTHRLLADGFDGIAGGDVRFAFAGRRGDPPIVEHIGHTRNGKGY